MLASLLSLALLAGVIAPVAAQTYTDCNPRDVACPPNLALGLSVPFNFTNTTIDTDTVWNVTNGEIMTNENGVAFTINAKKQAPTIKSNFYIFFGSVEVVMRASKGKGIVSSIFLQSDDLDEIDWEWVGGNNTHVQTNYFGKGNTKTYNRDKWIPVDDPQNKYHNYTINWNKDKIEWFIDTKLVRTLTYAESDGKGEFFPQTPMNIRIGNWDGGNADAEGVRQWALQTGSVDERSDFGGAPYTQSVNYIKVTDAAQNATSYTWSDKTGSWQSIKIEKGKSRVAEVVTAPPPESVNQKFNKLSTGAKIGIFASVGGVVLLLLILAAVCCIRQRKAGRLEKAAEDLKWEKGNEELMAYRTRMTQGGFSAQGGGFQQGVGRRY